MLKPGLTMEDYRGSDSIDDISDVRDFVILHNSPDPYFQSYARKRINEALSPSSLFEEGLSENFDFIERTSAMSSMKSFLIWHSNLKPSVYCIVNLQSLSKFLDLVELEVADVIVSNPEIARKIWRVDS